MYFVSKNVYFVNLYHLILPRHVLKNMENLAIMEINHVVSILYHIRLIYSKYALSSSNLILLCIENGLVCKI